MFDVSNNIVENLELKKFITIWKLFYSLEFLIYKIINTLNIKNIENFE